MFVSDDVCGVVLIISESTDVEFSGANFMELLKF